MADFVAFDDAVAMWLGFLENNKGRSPTTVVKYEGALNKLRGFLEPRGRDHLSVTMDDLDEFSGIWMIKRGMTSVGRKPVIAAVRGFFLFLVRNGVRADNPAMAIVSPKLPNGLPVFMPLADAEKLLKQPDLETFGGVRDAAMIATLIGCGFRVSGLVGLNESSLIFAPDEKGREMLVIRVVEKGKKERLVPAPEEVRLLIRAYLGHPYLQGIVRDLDDGDKVLFVSQKNTVVKSFQYYGEKRRITKQSIDSIIKKYGEAAGISSEKLHAHSLRHLYGTELAESDTNILHMKALLGHVSADTVDIYNHTAMRKLRKVSKNGNPLGKIRTPVSALIDKLK